MSLKEKKLYTTKLLYDEIQELKLILEHIESLIEERILGIDEPLPDEVEAIKEYDVDKEKGKTELINLNDVIVKKDD